MSQMRIPDPIGATSVINMEHGVISAEAPIVACGIEAVCAIEALDRNAFGRSPLGRIGGA